MPTGQQLITNAITSLNISDAGGSISGSETADLLGELNVMLDAWSTDETLIPSIAVGQYPLTANTNPYALGPIAAGFAGAALFLPAKTAISAITDAVPAVMTTTAIVPPLVSGQVVNITGFTAGWITANGAWQITVLSPTTFSIPINATGFGAISGAPVFQTTPPRPVRIDGAVQVSTVGAGVTRRPLRIVGSDTYLAHGDLAAAATTIDEVYADWTESASGSLNINCFPVPSCPTATSLELATWNAILNFALGVNVNLPPGYQDVIQQGLAYRCLARYGAAVNQATAQLVTSLGVTAKDRVREMNVRNRVLDPRKLPPTQEQLEMQKTQQPQGRQ
jgi:hypothetical protein